MRQTKGFTLVELMVAMAIIGVLLGLAIFGVSAAQRGQRDTARKAALQDINIGIQDYYDRNNRYPAYVRGDGTNIYLSDNSGCTGAKTITVPLKNVQTTGGTTGCTAGSTAVTIGSTVDNQYTRICLRMSGATAGYIIGTRLENASVFDVGSSSDHSDSANGCGSAFAN